MKFSKLFILLFFCLNLNLSLSYSQGTKILTESNYDNDINEFIVIKKRVLNKVPYLQHGKTEIWIGNTLGSVINYTNGELDGTSTDYLKKTMIGYIGCNNNPVLKKVYKKGKLVSVKGYWCDDKIGVYPTGEEYYENGELKRTILYYKNSNKKSSIEETGLSTYWFENGIKNEEYTLNIKKNYEGVYQKWFNTGKIELEGNYKDGYKDGVWTWYTKEGSISEQREFKLGEKILTEEELKAEEERLAKIEEEKKIKQEAEQKRIEELEQVESLNIKISDLNNKINSTEDLYKVEDFLLSSIEGSTVYKFKKNRMYQKYLILLDYLKNSINTSSSFEQLKYIELALKLTDKMKTLRNQKTKTLEKQLKSINKPEEILEAFSLTN